MEKKTVRSGAPFLFAGCGVMAVALTAGIGTIPSYLLAAGVGCIAFAVGKAKFPDRVIEVETAPKSGNAEVDALIREARAQLNQIAAANDAIAEPALPAKIDRLEDITPRIFRAVENFFPDAFHSRTDQFGLGIKIVVDGAYRYAARCGDGADADVRPALLANQFPAGFQNFLPGCHDGIHTSPPY